MLGAVIGKAADVAGQAVNHVAQGVIQKEKGGSNLEELVAPVQQEMREKFPGLELLAIPGQTQLVLQQKIEAAEVMADLADIALGVAGVDASVSMETPNTYAVKGVDGTTFYLIKETDRECDYCWRNQCRTCMPLHFEVVSMHRKAVVAKIESPWGCDSGWCGTYGFIPVCCCLREATWTRLSNGEAVTEAPVAKVRLACTTGDCGCAKRFEAVTADETTKVSLYKRCCCCRPGGCTPAEVFSELNILDDEHPNENPMGRIWHKFKIEDYEPTTDRYPKYEKEESLTDIVKSIAKEVFTDADTFFIECPHDNPDAKAALITAALINDFCYHEHSES